MYLESNSFVLILRVGIYFTYIPTKLRFQLLFVYLYLILVLDFGYIIFSEGNYLKNLKILLTLVFVNYG